eukprot:3770210-Lingulodinium_polyedra.AAC.1
MDREYRCTEILMDGSVCGKAFSTKHGLACHWAQQRRMGEQLHVASFVKTNSCPWCQSVFSTKGTAVQHVRRAFETHHCAVDRAYTPTKLQDLHDITCP